MVEKSIEWMSPERAAWIRDYSDEFRKASQHVCEVVGNAEHIAGLTDSITAFERFFTRASEMRGRAAAVRKEFPANTDEMMKVSENILAHRFDILGSGLREFGFPLKWHCDIRSGYCWPSDADLLEMGRAAFDILVVNGGGVELKAPWDLSNMHWLMTLACAWHLSGDRKYLEAFERDVTDWIDSNPPFKGVNWFCAMNVGMRAVNIISAVAAVHPFLDSLFLKKILASLYLHGINISANLEIEKGAKRNNHYLSDLIGLFFLGTLFKDSPDGGKWLEFSKTELEREMILQFKSDGVCFEGSTSYHRLSAEIMLLCAMLGESSGNRFSEEFVLKLDKSLGFTRDILQSNNNIPQFGDNDNGRILPLFGYMALPSTDHRHILALGGEFLDDDSIRAPGADAGSEAIWLLGHFKKNKTSPSGKMMVRSYGDSGFHIVKSPDATLVVFNGKVEQGCGGGHYHCDLLGFTLNYKGMDVFADPGSYIYSSDFRARNDFRSTEYHNTVQVGNSEIRNFNRDTFEDLWWVRDCCEPIPGKLYAECDTAVFKGGVNSYLQKYGVVVDRMISWNDAEGVLLVSDSCRKGAGDADMAIANFAVSRFLLGPGLSVEMKGDCAASISEGDARIANLAVTEGARLSSRKLWYSPEYGRRVPAYQLEVRWDLRRVNHIESKVAFI